jgi:hypothetical protein
MAIFRSFGKFDYLMPPSTVPKPARQFPTVPLGLPDSNKLFRHNFTVF